MLYYFVYLAVSVVVCEGIVNIICKSYLFTGIRNFLSEKSEVLNSKIVTFFDYVVSCPYCLSVWVSAFLTIPIFIFTHIKLLFLPIDLLFFLVSCHTMSNKWHDFTDRYLSKKNLED